MPPAHTGQRRVAFAFVCSFRIPDRVFDPKGFVRFKGVSFEAGILDLDTAAIVIPDIRKRGRLDLNEALRKVKGGTPP
jgi:hypothetical protein